MDADRRETVRRLFVLATEIAETTHEAAVSGQASATTPTELGVAAESLRRRANELKAIGQAIAIAISGGATEWPAEESD